MEAPDKKLLNSNRVYLVENLKEIDAVVDALREQNVLSIYEKEEVEAKRTRMEKVRCMLDHLARNPGGLNKLLIAICRADHSDLADRVRPGFSSSPLNPGKKIQEEEKNDQRNVSTVSSGSKRSAATVEQQTNKKPATDASKKEDKIEADSFSEREEVHMVYVQRNVAIRYPPGSDETYSMSSQSRGIALIINNQKFTTNEIEERTNSSRDVELLKGLFQWLKFNVVTHFDCTAQGIRNTLECCLQDCNQNTDAFVCVVMSHGQRGAIAGVDGTLILPEEDIIKRVQEFTALAGKPKLFFFQACRGDAVDRGNLAPMETDHEVGGAAGSSSGASRNVRISVENSDREDMPLRIARLIPQASDVLVAYSTPEGYTSPIRGPVECASVLGRSPFVECINQVFRQHAHEDHVVELLTRVNRLMTQKGPLGRGDGSQASRNVCLMSNFVSSLTKLLYFYPDVLPDVFV